MNWLSVDIKQWINFLIFRRSRFVCCSLVMFFSLTMFSNTEAEEQSFRVGFTSRMFTDVNEQDARAALRVFSDVLAAEHNIPIQDDIFVVSGDKILDLFRHNEVDAMALMTDELLELLPNNPIDYIFTIRASGHRTESYVLLVHQDSSIGSLSDLRGKNIIVDDNARSSMAIHWLNILLSEANLPPIDRLAGTLSTDNRLGQVVLPIFFRQADAALVTLSGFQTMAELNPQVSQKLAILAESEDVIPNVFVIRAGYDSSFKSYLIDSLSNLHAKAAGRQVLKIFRADTLEMIELSDMESSFKLLKRAKSIER